LPGSAFFPFQSNTGCVLYFLELVCSSPGLTHNEGIAVTERGENRDRPHTCPHDTTPPDGEREMLARRLRWAQEGQKLAVHILTLLSKRFAGRETLRDILELLRDFTGFEAVGIRLREEDFPYFETKGFPGHFVEKESSFCSRSAAGEIVRDAQGNAVLECLCGVVLQGRTNPAFPFFTEGGSFWTNSTTELLATISEQELQTKTRNRCAREGYESLALIPLRSDQETIGLLQLNDSRKNCFTPDMIHFLEDIGVSAGIVLKQQRVEEERDRLFNLSLDMLSIAGFDGFFRQVNPACTKTLGWTKEEFLSRPIVDFIHPDDREETISAGARLSSGESLHQFRNRCRCKDGSYRWISWNAYPLRDANLIFAVARDVTDLKHQEDFLLKANNELEERVTQRTEALRESEQRFKAVFENDHVVMLVIDPETGAIEDASLAACTFYRYTRDEIMAKRMSEIDLLATHEMLQQLQIAKSRQRTYFDYRHRLANGEVRDVEVCSGPVAVGGKTLLFSVITDVTERKKAEDDLRTSEERLELALQGAGLGLWDLDLRSGKVVVNDRVTEISGYAPDELVPNVTSWDKICHPDDKERVLLALSAHVNGETPAFEEESRIRTKSGQWKWILTRGKVVEQDEHGQPMRMAGTLLDIAAKKKSEQVHLRLATAVENAQETVLITDVEGTILYVNPAFTTMTGYDRDEVVGQNTRILKSGEHHHAFYQNLWETITQGKVWKGRFINRRKDGTLYPEEATITPVRDRSGRMVNFVAVKRDVTQELALQEQLVHAQKMEAIGTLAGGIAHDFNNLLQITLGYSELLLSEKNEDDSEYQDLHRILEAAQHGTDLVERLMTFSRRVEPKIIPLNLNLKIEQVAKLLSRTIPKMISIELELDPEVPNVHADPTQLEQVLMNLAVNACDAMPAGGKLRIATHHVIDAGSLPMLTAGDRSGEYVHLSFSDTGLGMDATTVDHMFEPFFTTKGLGRGTGLGLAIVYGIIAQHHGFIDCQSEPGRGTTFHVYFPALPSQYELELKSAETQPPRGSETLLLVDDEDSLRDLGERVLSKAGYGVLTAANGIEARELFARQAEEISLVILDLIMPEMGGKECLKELLLINPHIRVLVVSGYSPEMSKQELLSLGIRGFLSKPFSVGELLRQVRKALDQS
jgi:PAS domain S-box-containing protein